MSDILNKTIVLVLNRNWQAINVRTPQEAFCMMATNVATALEIEGENHIRPVTWDEWITLPIRDGDNLVRTARGEIRVPTVIVAVNFAKVPKKRPKLCAKTIRERDGNRCQYTGKLLKPVVTGPEKARLIREHAREKSFDLNDCFAFSDSYSDVPMLSVVGHPAAVNPDKRLALLAKAYSWPLFDLTQPA